MFRKTLTKLVFLELLIKFYSLTFRMFIFWAMQIAFLTSHFSSIVPSSLSLKMNSKMMWNIIFWRTTKSHQPLQAAPCPTSARYVSYFVILLHWPKRRDSCDYWLLVSSPLFAGGLSSQVGPWPSDIWGSFKACAEGVSQQVDPLRVQISQRLHDKSDKRKGGLQMLHLSD